MFDLSDQFVTGYAALDPINATYEGIVGHDAGMTDYSPDGFARRNEFVKRYVSEIGSIEIASDRDVITRDVMLERLRLQVDTFESGNYLRATSFSWSPMQEIRSVFDQMSYESTDDWETAGKRLAQVPNALEQIKETLRLGLAQNMLVARRQIVACARQARVWAGTDLEKQSFFRAVIESDGSNLKGKLRDKLETGADKAAAAFDELSDFLVSEYAPKTEDVDAVGRERYVRSAQEYLGMTIDPEATYAWGWEELARLDAEINEVITQIKPGASIAEVIELLNNDHERWITGEDALVSWLKAFLDRAIASLDRTTFDIPAPLKNLDVRVAPPGGPANQYYTTPTEDFSRPGIYWYPTVGRTRFPIWAEISTAYHEGVPGHHLQCGLVKVLHEQLSRYQRNMFVSGHGEGWALYAERLMDEVGGYERPEYKLDMLLSHYFRAARVVVDIGLHLGLKIPAASSFHGGEVWTPELAHTFMLEHSNQSDSFVASEIIRYLGIPGQAISYKVGEKVWLDARARAKQNLGSKFDLKIWHNEILALGPMGLAQLQSLSLGPVSG